MTDARTYNVRCSDGTRRHKEPFASLADAQHFAEWGHCCLAANTHVIEDVNDSAGAYTYDLKAGGEGYWPVIGAGVLNIRIGDRLSEGDEPLGVVTRIEDRTLRVYIETDTGHEFTVGKLARGLKVDRFGTAGILADSIR